MICPACKRIVDQFEACYACGYVKEFPPPPGDAPKRDAGAAGAKAVRDYPDALRRLAE